MSSVDRQDPFADDPAEPSTPLSAVQHLIAQDPDIFQEDERQLQQAALATLAEISDKLDMLDDLLTTKSTFNQRIMTKLNVILDAVNVLAWKVGLDLTPITEEDLLEEIGPNYSLEAVRGLQEAKVPEAASE